MNSPPQTVSKQVGDANEASLQKLIAPRKWRLPTVNSNYCVHGFYGKIPFIHVIQELRHHNSSICIIAPVNRSPSGLLLLLIWFDFRHSEQINVKGFEKLDSQIRKSEEKLRTVDNCPGDVNTSSADPNRTQRSNLNVGLTTSNSLDGRTIRSSRLLVNDRFKT